MNNRVPVLRALLPASSEPLISVFEERFDKTLVFLTKHCLEWALFDGERWYETSFFRRDGFLYGALHEAWSDEVINRTCMFQAKIIDYSLSNSMRWQADVARLESSVTISSNIFSRSQPAELTKLRFRTATLIGEGIGVVNPRMRDLSNCRVIISNGIDLEEFYTTELDPVSSQWSRDRKFNDVFVSLDDWRLMEPYELPAKMIQRINAFGVSGLELPHFEYIDTLPARSLHRALEDYFVWEWTGPDHFGLGTLLWIASRDEKNKYRMTIDNEPAGFFTPVGSIAAITNRGDQHKQFPVAFAGNGQCAVIFSLTSIYGERGAYA